MDISITGIIIITDIITNLTYTAIQDGTTIIIQAEEAILLMYIIE
jgi:hypothetical protein